MNKLIIIICISFIFTNCEKDSSPEPQPAPRTQFLKIGEYTSFHIEYRDWYTQTKPNTVYHLSHKDSVRHYDSQTYDREMITNDSTIELQLDYYYTYSSSIPWWPGTYRTDIDSNQRVVLNWTSDFEFEVILTHPDGTPIDSEIWPLNTSDLILEYSNLGTNASIKRWRLENSEHNITFHIYVWYH